MIAFRTSLLLLLMLPLSTHAVLRINEVAWMGSAASANDEWIELYNTGSDTIDVSGWQLTSASGLAIPLSGSVSAGRYAVLERTDDSSAPGSALVVYTGALTNSGTTLTLRDEAGTVVDQVVGGSDWELIGGNNNTKNTPQFYDGTWLTAAPTPAASNATTPSEVDADFEVGETPPNSEQAAKENRDPEAAYEALVQRSDRVIMPETTEADTELVLPDVTLSTELQMPAVAFVGESLRLQASSSGIGEAQVRSLTHTWNFGDGNTETGRQVTHRYRYPGTQIVTLHSAFGRHEQVARAQISVLPQQLELARNTAGDILLHNNASYAMDLSGYRIRGHDTFVLPKYTTVAALGTITLPKATVIDTARESSSMLALYDTGGTVRARLLPNTFDSRQANFSSLQPQRASAGLATEQLTAAQVNTMQSSEASTLPAEADTRSTSVASAQSSRTSRLANTASRESYLSDGTDPNFRFASEVAEASSNVAMPQTTTSKVPSNRASSTVTSSAPAPQAVTEPAYKATAEEATDSKQLPWSYLGLIGILVLSLLVVVISRRP